MPGSTAKNPEVAWEELDKGRKQIATHQRSEWLTTANLAGQQWKHTKAMTWLMRNAWKRWKEAARHLAKKRSRRGCGNFSWDAYGIDMKRSRPADRPEACNPYWTIVNQFETLCITPEAGEELQFWHESLTIYRSQNIWTSPSAMRVVYSDASGTGFWRVYCRTWPTGSSRPVVVLTLSFQRMNKFVHTTVISNDVIPYT